MKRILMWVVAGACIGPVAYPQEMDVHILVAEANQAFADGEYAAALEAYSAMELKLPQSPELAYNRGAASYMLGDYAQARDAFNRSLLTRDVGLEAKIKFNLGDVAFASARKKMSNPPEAINLLKSAIVHWRDAVELDPEDDDARINIELAERQIRDLVEKLKQRREERRQGQENQQEPEKDNREQQQGGERGGEQKAGTEKRQQEQTQGQTDEGLTQREVEQLLQAVRDKEQQRRNELEQRRRVGRTPVAKDW